jgi:DNA-binding transcriptional LysR family regulator
MDQLACIRAFIETVEGGSLHSAAKKLHQTDAAISKKISKLEMSLNINLLERKRGQLRLTELGEQYYSTCKDAVDKILTAKQLIQQAISIPQGALKVACNRSNVECYLIPKLKSFLQHYPQIELTIHVAERAPDFSKAEMDILFGFGMSAIPEQSGLVQKRLAVTRQILCATPAYLQQNIIPKTPKDILQLNYICHIKRRPVNVINFDKDVEVKVKPFLKFDDVQATLMAALQDLGYIYAKEYMIQRYLDSRKLVEILPKYNKTTVPIYVFYLHQLYTDPKIRAFIDFFTPK